MKLYNTATRKIENFNPIKDGEVKIYTCGPTVYHFAHIGNLRTYIFEDILEKTFKYLGFKVNRVMNITDVGHLTSDADEGEDKMLLGAKREKKSVLEIAKFYTEAFKKDIELLNLNWPETVIPATACIDTYIEIITVLLDKGFAYISNGNIYFDVSKLENYNVLTNQKAEEMRVGVRETVKEDLEKRNPQDFVLWFTKSKFENQELKWDSPWGVGYPGWHIECSGISYKYLGEYLDIHCGGVDNIFPHHTNEIAQSESFLGHKWCNFWFHVEHLNLSKTKMSKSKDGFITLSKLIEQGYSPEVYKFLCLQSHYRKILVFSYESLDMAKAAYEKLVKRISKLKRNKEPLNLKEIEKFDEQFKDALKNDLNTSLAITTIFDVLKSNLNDNSKIKLLEKFDKVCGLSFDKILNNTKNSSKIEIEPDFLNFINEKIALRNYAKENKDYETADKIRNELLEKGVTLIDKKSDTEFFVEN
ncbi:MAG: cysteine--tRNA ligase [Clostridia bacterium]|nr:cysteine--tRNA ligase [Clostridia bacterium]